MPVLQKLSAIIMELAQTAFVKPNAIPSSEVAHAALLFAQVAWNRALGHETEGYQELLKVFVRSNPKLWSELSSRDPEALIRTMSQVKARRYPDDVRVIVVSGMREGNVHVEWCDEKDYEQACELAKLRLDLEYGKGCSVGHDNSVKKCEPDSSARRRHR
jgi:hypothetical protein